MAASDRNPLYYTVRQVRALLGGPEAISAPTIRRWCAAGVIPAIRAGRSWLIPRAYIHQQYDEAIRRFAASTSTPTADGRPAPAFPQAPGVRPVFGEGVA